MRTVCLTVSYDGTDYAGWQVQPDVRTVQQELQLALARITGDPGIQAHASGRTDCGVHARAQVVHFETDAPIAAGDWVRAVNANLPGDIRILEAKEVDRTFHARFSACGKEYRYYIWNEAVLPPFYRLYRLHETRTLDVELMKRAAGYLEGRHDFAAFTAEAKRPVESTERHLSLLDVRKKGAEIVIRAQSDGFLYKMVRSLAGGLIRVGKGQLSPDDIREILNSRTRTARIPTAPPQGLFLWRVWYETPLKTKNNLLQSEV